MKICDVVEYGAETYPRDSTKGFRRACAACADGGRVVVPQGKFKTGAFNLTQQELLVKGTIIGHEFDWSSWKFHYPAVPVLAAYPHSRDACCTPWSSVVLAQKIEHSALITMRGHSVRIIGQGGKIYGNGYEYWRRFLCFSMANARQMIGLFPLGHCLPPDETAYKISNVAYPLGRPRLIETRGAHRVSIRDIELHDSAFWTVRIAESQNVILENLKIRAPDKIVQTLIPGLAFGFVKAKPRWAPNSDGIDIDSSSNVFLSEIDVRVGDDAVSLKAGLLKTAKPTSNIRIQNSKLRSQWLSLGSETAGGISHVQIENCSFGRSKTKSGADLYSYTDSGLHGGPAGVHIKTRIGRSGYVDDIRLSAIDVFASDAIMKLTTSYPTEADAFLSHDGFTRLGSFALSDVHCLSGCKHLIDISAFPESPLQNIKVSDSSGHISCANVQSFTRDGHIIPCATTEPRTRNTFALSFQEYPQSSLLALAVLGLIVAKRLRPDPTKVPMKHFSRAIALGTLLRCIQWLSITIGPGSALSTPFALTPAPLTGPLLRVYALCPLCSVLFSMITALALLFALSHRTPIYVFSICKFWLLVASFLTALDAIFVPTYDAPLRASHRTRFCSRAWHLASTSMPPGVEHSFLIQACADFMKLGEPASTLWGLLTNFLTLFLLLLLPSSCNEQRQR